MTRPTGNLLRILDIADISSVSANIVDGILIKPKSLG